MVDPWLVLLDIMFQQSTGKSFWVSEIFFGFSADMLAIDLA